MQLLVLFTQNTRKRKNDATCRGCNAGFEPKSRLMYREQQGRTIAEAATIRSGRLAQLRCRPGGPGCSADGCVGGRQRRPGAGGGGVGQGAAQARGRGMGSEAGQA